MSLHNIKVFVTGSSGFIGGFLCKTLVSSCAEVRVLIRDFLDEAPAVRQGMVPVFGDVNSRDILTQAIEGCDVVCHLAAGAGTYEAARKVNVEGTRNVLDAALSCGVQKVITLSSVAAYGSSLPAVVDENFPLTKKGDPYELTKADAERLIEEYRKKYDLDITILRPTLVYGPKSSTWTTNLFKRILYDEIFLINDGKGLMNLIYVDDLVTLIIRAIEDSRSKNETFNANGSERVTWAEYLGAFSNMLGKKPERSVSLKTARFLLGYYSWRYRFTRIPGPVTAFDVKQQSNTTLFSSDKAKAGLGFTASISLRQGMKLTANWLRLEGLLPDRNESTIYAMPSGGQDVHIHQSELL